MSHPITPMRKVVVFAMVALALVGSTATTLTIVHPIAAIAGSCDSQNC